MEQDDDSTTGQTTSGNDLDGRSEGLVESAEGDQIPEEEEKPGLDPDSPPSPEVSDHRFRAAGERMHDADLSIDDQGSPKSAVIFHRKAYESNPNIVPFSFVYSPEDFDTEVFFTSVMDLWRSSEFGQDEKLSRMFAQFLASQAGVDPGRMQQMLANPGDFGDFCDQTNARVKALKRAQQIAGVETTVESDGVVSFEEPAENTVSEEEGSRSFNDYDLE